MERTRNVPKKAEQNNKRGADCGRRGQEGWKYPTEVPLVWENWAEMLEQYPLVFYSVFHTLNNWFLISINFMEMCSNSLKNNRLTGITTSGDVFPEWYFRPDMLCFLWYIFWLATPDSTITLCLPPQVKWFNKSMFRPSCLYRRTIVVMGIFDRWSVKFCSHLSKTFTTKPVCLLASLASLKGV